MSTKEHLMIIIGSGPAGLTAGVYAARANLHPLILEGAQPGGQLMNTTAVENWPGEKSIMGPQLMAKMRDHAKHFGAHLVADRAVRVDFTQRPFKVFTNKGVEITAHTVIVATGAIPNRLNCPGEETYWSKGVTTCAVCDGAFYAGKRVMVVGGGDTAMEDASFLQNFTTDITIVQNLATLSASHAMQQRVLNNPSIKIIYNSTVSAIEGNGSHVTGVTIINKKGNIESKIPLDGVFIAIGFKPNTDPFKGQLATNEYGYLIVTDHTKTSVEGVFAAGDVYDYRYRQAITAAGSGCMAALDAERYLKSIGL